MQPSIPLLTLIKLFFAKDSTVEKLRSLDLPPEPNNVASKVDTQNLPSEYYNSKHKFPFTATIDPNNKLKLNFEKIAIIVIPTTLFQTVFGNNGKTKKMENGSIILYIHWLKKNFLSFHSLVRRFWKSQLILNPTLYKIYTLHFPLRIAKTLLPKTGNIEPLFAEVPQTHSVLKLKQ